MRKLRRVSRTKSVTEKTYEALKEAIITGRFVPGQALVTEVIANELGVSRTPVRDALLMLKQEGFVEGEATTGRSAFVAELSLKDLSELFELRQVLEVGALRLVAARASGSVVSSWRERLESHRHPASSEQAEAASHADLAFHAGLMKATRNKEFTRVWEQLSAQLQRFWHQGRAIPGRAAVDIEECLGVVEALEADELELAIDRLEQHLNNTQRAIASWHQARQEAT